MYRITLTGIGSDPLVTARVLSDVAEVDIRDAYALLKTASLPCILFDGICQDKAFKIEKALKNVNACVEVTQHDASVALAFAVDENARKLAKSDLKYYFNVPSGIILIQFGIVISAALFGTLLAAKIGIILFIISGWLFTLLTPKPLRFKTGRCFLLTSAFMIIAVCASKYNSLLNMILVLFIFHNVADKWLTEGFGIDEQAYPFGFMPALFLFMNDSRWIALVFCLISLLYVFYEMRKLVVTKTASGTGNEYNSSYSLMIMDLENRPKAREIIGKYNSYDYESLRFLDSDNIPAAVVMNLTKEYALVKKEELDNLGIDSRIAESNEADIMRSYDQVVSEYEKRYMHPMVLSGNF